jgi:uncharacterized membrane protein YbhN (UPF0104 family)
MNQQVLFQKGWNIAKLLLAILLIFVVVSKTNITQIKILKDEIAWGWFSLHFLSFVLMTLVKAYQYHLLFGSSTKYKNVLRVVLWQNAISNFIASSAGIASYMAMLKAEHNVKLSRSGVIFIITKFGDLLAICLYLGVSAGLVWNQIQLLKWLSILLIGGLLLGLGIFLIVVIRRERVVTFVTGALAFLKLDHFSLVSRGMEGLRSLAMENKKAVFNLLRTGVLMSLAYMTITMVSAYTGIRMFNVDLGVWPVIYVAALMQLVSFVPIQVLGGLGVTEVTSVYLYSFFGLDQGVMSAVMLGLRAVFYLMNLLILLYLPMSVFLEKHKPA